MKRLVNHVMGQIPRLWQTSAPLTATGLLMLVALAAFLGGMLVDPRSITGVPAWLKPAKFAASIAIYTLTLAWVFTYLHGWTKTRSWVGWVTAIMLVLEMVIIAGQAWRGTTSHFNVGQPFDLTLWVTMGVAIVVNTLVSVAVAIALWCQHFADKSLGWALRLGLVITIIGATSGGLMTQPTADQMAQARATHRLPVAGAHTVGAPDGGAGLPGTGWSLEHGDLRVPHFIGLHALQGLPLISLSLRSRRWSEATRVRLTLVSAASYLALFVILLGQALSGQSLVAPDSTTLGVLAVWAALTAVAAWAAATRHVSMPAHAR